MTLGGLRLAIWFAVGGWAVGCGAVDGSELLSAPGAGADAGAPTLDVGPSQRRDAGREGPPWSSSRTAAYVSPSTLDFGEGARGDVLTESFTVYNLEDQAALVHVLELDSEVFSLTNGPVAQTLEPGERLSVEVTFSPRVGDHRHELTVYACGAGCPQTVMLSGLGRGAPMGCTDTNLGSVRVGECRTQTVRCVHGNPDPIDVRPSVSPGIVFGVLSHRPLGPVPADVLLELDVEFCPDARSTVSARLEFGYPDGLRDRERPEVRGRGI